MRVVMHIALLGALAIGSGCGSGEPSAPARAHVLHALGEPQYRGPIVQAVSARSRVLVQYRPAGVNSGRMWISVQASTPMLAADGRDATRAALQPGVVVSVWSRQTVLESDPGQTGADAILIGG